MICYLYAQCYDILLQKMMRKKLRVEICATVLLADINNRRSDLLALVEKFVEHDREIILTKKEFALLDAKREKQQEKKAAAAKKAADEAAKKAAEEAEQEVAERRRKKKNDPAEQQQPESNQAAATAKPKSKIYQRKEKDEQKGKKGL